MGLLLCDSAGMDDLGQYASEASHKVHCLS